MTVLWLFPTGLAALAALLLPLLIHLARRDQQQLIDFAALRWLAARPRPRHRLRFDEWPLLLVRLLLLALLAVLLARPALQGLRDDTPRIAVLPGVAPAQARAAAGDAEATWLWLAPGFPRIGDATAVPDTGQPLASLLRELDATLPPEAPLTVIVPTVADGWDAQRPQLSRPLQWQGLDTPPAAITATEMAPPRLQVRLDPAGSTALPWLHAIGQAWNPDMPAASADDPRPFAAGDDVRVWLSSKPVPEILQAWTREGGRLLVDARTPLPDDAQRLPLWHDGNGTPLIEQVDSSTGRWLRWAAPLQPASNPAMLEADFPQRLLELLQPSPLPARARSATMQPLGGMAAWPQPPREPTTWLVAAIALLFLLERWLASAPRRRA